MLRHARAEQPIFRDFPRAPGTVPCTVRPGGRIHNLRLGGVRPRGVLYGSCTTTIAGQSADGGLQVVFSERLHGGASALMQTGKFTATLSPTGRVLHIEAVGQTPQTWR